MWDGPTQKLGLEKKPIASVTIADCVVDLRRQPSSNDLWTIATGPLGSWQAQVLSGESIAKRSERGPLPVPKAVLRRGSVEVRVDGEFALHLRARGRRLAVTYVYKGSPFGGGDFGLPSGHKLNFWQRLHDFLRGRRGDGVAVFVSDGQPKID